MNTMETSATEDIFDNFCCSVVEEYLIRKNLSATLSTLRAEWQRPSEVSFGALNIFLSILYYYYY